MTVSDSPAGPADDLPRRRRGRALDAAPVQDSSWADLRADGVGPGQLEVLPTAGGQRPRRRSAGPVTDPPGYDMRPPAAGYDVLTTHGTPPPQSLGHGMSPYSAAVSPA